MDKKDKGILSGGICEDKLPEIIHHRIDGYPTGHESIGS